MNILLVVPRRAKWARALLADHELVREDSGVNTVRSRATVRALLPVDVIGVFGLLPSLEF